MVVFGVLGAASAYILAWGMFLPARTLPANILSSPVGLWPEPAPLWPAPFVGHIAELGHNSTTWVVRAKHTPSGLVSTLAYPEVSRFWQEITIGFPFRCARQRIRQENWHVPVPIGHTPAPRIDDGTDIPHLLGSGITVPWRPVWPGLLGNTVIHGLAFFLIFMVLRRTYTWIDSAGRDRRRRGLCPRCGYDRTGLTAEAKCPECGAANKAGK